VRFLGVQGTLQLRSDRRRHRPYGLAGGADGAASNNELGEADGHGMTWRQLPTKFTRAIHHGQVLRHTTAGGGGYGDPLRRDPEAVLADVSAGKVTPEAAADTYGVSVIPHPWRIDGDATEALRARRND
jgi:N-methylhydantoinase B